MAMPTEQRWHIGARTCSVLVLVLGLVLLLRVLDKPLRAEQEDPALHRNLVPTSPTPQSPPLAAVSLSSQKTAAAPPAPLAGPVAADQRWTLGSYGVVEGRTFGDPQAPVAIALHGVGVLTPARYGCWCM